MISSTAANKHAVVRRFDSSLIAGCSEKTNAIIKYFESYSGLVSSSLQSASDKISVNELGEPQTCSFQVGVIITI